MENREAVNEREHAALTLLRARPEVFGRQGAVVATWQRWKGRKLGPYYLLSYREAGRQRAVYLGRSGPLVEQVREALAGLQRGRRRQEAYERARREIRGALRAHQRRLDAALRGLGLRLHGYSVRGWRKSRVV